MLRKFAFPMLFCALTLNACNSRPERAKFGPNGPSEEVGEGTLLLVNTAFPRLSHLQWENSVRDVLLLSNGPGLSSSFLPDPPGSIFGNDSSLLKVTPNLWSDYQSAAEKVAADFVTNADQVKKITPSSLPSDANAQAKSIITPLAKRAYRRIPTAVEIDALISLFQKGKELTGQSDATLGGIQVVITALLLSPNFLYRPELGDSQSGPTVNLNANEIASRLSYAIWNTIPDDTLIDLANSGELLKPEVRSAQATRMMQDPKALDILTSYYARILRIDSYLNISGKDPTLFPEWTAGINETLRQEAELFIKDVVGTSNKGLNEILTAPYTFVNEKNAPLYGLNATGSEMKKVNLDTAQRSGFLTHVGFLSQHSTPTETDPIHRGVYSNVNLICADLVPPAGIIPSLPKDTAAKTMRERVEAHTGKGTCGSSCHGNQINPAGYAFENFDAAGRWRTIDHDQTVDAASEMTLGGSKLAFNGGAEFSKALASSIEVHKCFASKAVELLYGRVHDQGDNALIESLAKDSLAGGSTKDLFFKLLIDAKITQRIGKE